VERGWYRRLGGVVPMELVMNISGDSRKWYQISGDYRDSKWFTIGFFTIVPVAAGISVATDSYFDVFARWTGASVAVLSVVVFVFFFLRSGRRKSKHRR
jgi:hypothetical protein